MIFLSRIQLYSYWLRSVACVSKFYPPQTLFLRINFVLQKSMWSLNYCLTHSQGYVVGSIEITSLLFYQFLIFSSRPPRTVGLTKCTDFDLML